MTIRYLDALLRPSRVRWLGCAATPAQFALLEKLRGQTEAIEFQDWPEGIPADAAAIDSPWLAVLSDTQLATAAVVARLGELGCRGLIWSLHEPPARAVIAAAGAHTLRILGPRSVGLSRGGGFDLSTLAQTPAPGSLALIVQSQSVAAAAADWAAGRRIGFSWIAVTGGEADVDVSDLLDYAALDPDTRAVALEVGSIGGARKFMSAARACARAKPTVVLQTRLVDRGAAGADPVRSAAFARAGMVEVPNLPGLFDALAALQQLPPMPQPRVLVVANGAALCALSVDALLRQGLSLAELPESTQQALWRRLPTVRFRRGAVDIGDPEMAQTLAILRELIALEGVDALMFVRSPVAGYPHEPVARAVSTAALGARVLTVWLGLESALGARRLSAEAGQPTFTSPDAAARALRYRWEYASNRELLTQTPPRLPPPSLDRERVQRRLQEHLGAGSDTEPAAALELLHAYGLASQPRLHRDALELEVRVERHPELGLHIAARIHGFKVLPLAYGFVPLDSLLAGRLLAAIGLDAASGVGERDLRAANTALVRLAQIPMDQAAVERLELRLAIRGGRARVARDARLWLTPGPAPERERLALAPYPEALRHTLERPGHRPQVVRPVLPEDEPAVIALLQSLDAETVRLRFFAHIRHFTHGMAARMTQIDYDRELALVVHLRDQPEHLHAMATLIADPDGAEAEFAVLVHQDHARLGLGRHLLRALLDHAAQRGIGRVWGQVLADNSAMLGLARALGFRRLTDPHEPTCRRVEIDVVPLHS